MTSYTHPKIHMSGENGGEKYRVTGYRGETISQHPKTKAGYAAASDTYRKTMQEHEHPYWGQE